MINNWAIVVGIDHYDFLPEKNHLQFARQDALAMQRFLCQDAGFSADRVLLCGNQGSRIATKAVLRDILLHEVNHPQRAQNADNLWFFFSGHGMAEHLMTIDANPRDLKETAISIQFVAECLRDCKAKNIVLILDMCRDENPDPGRKNITEMETALRQLSKDQEGQQGIVTLLSCSKGESSYEIAGLGEDKNLGQGAFTHALLEGLRENTTPKALEKYLARRIPELHQAAGKVRKQVPVIIPEPGWKYELPILSHYATTSDVSSLKDLATDAEVDDRDFEKAIRLWKQINELAIDSADRRRAMNKIIDLTQRFHQTGISSVKTELPRPPLFSVSLGDNLDLEMVRIPAGRFMMGSPDDEVDRYPNEGPQHWVTVPEFYFGKYAVTQAQWRAIAQQHPISRELKLDPSRFKGDTLPVESISWYEAVEFCQRLSKWTGQVYHLPSEAEWEYACRAGTETPFHFGDTISTEVANYDGNYVYSQGTKGIYREQTTDVGSFEVANAFGLYDMHGNVWEWCEDDYDDNYKEALGNSSAWLGLEQKENSGKILRGGSWLDLPGYCRSAYRNRVNSDVQISFIGFRVVYAPARTF
jgi:formylglycine-generating enzyme required for sulfatase activity